MDALVFLCQLEQAFPVDYTIILGFPDSGDIEAGFIFEEGLEWTLIITADMLMNEGLFTMFLNDKRKQFEDTFMRGGVYIGSKE